MPVRGNVLPFPRGPMSSTEASSVSVTHAAKLQIGAGMGDEVCVLSKKYHNL